MARSTLKMGAVAFALAGGLALASPSWASGATSAAKKPGPSIETAVLDYNRISHNVRYHEGGATSTEFSSVNRTSGHNVKSK
jgi:hypothetical protein